MNLESRLSGVATFLRPDKLELLSREEERDPGRNRLETEGVRSDGEETFETAFLIPLPPLVSNEEDVALLKEEEDDEEETDNDGLTEALLTVSCLVTSEPVDVLKLRSPGNTVVDFLVSEALTLFEGLATAEDNELLLSSGSDRLAGSEVFLPAVVVVVLVVALFSRLVAETADGFSGSTPPVLFRLTTEIEFEIRDAPATVDFFPLELELEPTKGLLGSTLFLTEPVDADTFDITAVPGFTVFIAFFPPSTELADACFSGTRGVSTGSSPCSTTTGSSILIHQITSFRNKAPEIQPGRTVVSKIK